MGDREDHQSKKGPKTNLMRIDSINRKERLKELMEKRRGIFHLK
jgi:hypothetical protein